MVRYHIFVEGRVQGVGFRYFVSMHAQSYGLTGSVKNLDNGLVEIYVQGESDTLTNSLRQSSRVMVVSSKSMITHVKLSLSSQMKDDFPVSIINMHTSFSKG